MTEDKYEDVKDVMEISEEGSRYRYVNSFSCLMSKTQIKKNIKNINGSIDKIKEELKKIESAEAITALEKKCRLEYTTAKKSLEDFDGELADRINKMRDSADGDKIILKQFIDNFENYQKDKLLNELQKQAKIAEGFVQQLLTHERDIKVYEDGIK